MKLDSVEQSQHLNKASRVIVTGASGWLGRTMLHILESHGAQYLLLGSSSRWENFSSGPKRVHKFTKELVIDFSPTLVTDFAFLTRETISKYSLSEYSKANRALIKEAMWLLSLPSVRGFVSTSSGAAVFGKETGDDSFENNPYGHLKRESEHLLMSLSDKLGVPHVVARPWSVSGEFVTKVQGFAFSQMIYSALTNRRIEILSDNPVYRRFVDVEDLLRVCMGILELGGSSRIIDSGGELVDLVQLAERIAKHVGPEVKVNQSVDYSQEGDRYYSSGLSWSEACSTIRYKPIDLDCQIAKVAKSLIAPE
jgi:nucleoside-diphosphate-sugar epimerase